MATIEDRSHIDVAPSDTVIRRKRLHSYHDHPFMIEKSTLAMRHFSGMDAENLKNQRLTSLAQKHGVHLSHATEVVKPMLCPPELSEKLMVGAEVPILYIERTVFTDRNVRVEWRQGWCHLRDKHYMSVTS
jgi:DNA-binding GntR family transcriptional regulator